MNLFFIEKIDKGVIIPLATGFMSAIFILALTLNLTAAVVVFAMSLASVAFCRSFSRGWLLLFFIMLLFPAVHVGDGMVLLNDLVLVTLSLVGLVKLTMTEQKKSVTNPLSYYFFLLVLLGSAILVCGYFFGQRINDEIWQLTITLVLIWIAQLVFQHYFQTPKRIRMFFKLLVAVGIIHSVFGIIMFLGGWQTSTGMGISNDKQQHRIFKETNYSVNGFLGIGLEDRLRANPLAPMLIITIPITFGWILVNRKRRVYNGEPLPAEEDLIYAEYSDFQEVPEKNSIKIVWRHVLDFINQKFKMDSIAGNAYTFIKEYDRKELFLWGTLILQVIAFLFTFSYGSLIFLAIGVLVMGMLERDRKLIAITATAILLFSAIIPNEELHQSVGASSHLPVWLNGIEVIADDWIWGSGWKMPARSILAINTTGIGNSFLYIWNNFGVFGVIILLVMIVKYFLHIYRGYIKSDGEKRIWLIVILAIFIGFIGESLRSNTLVYGPAALVFWLLFSVTLNLRRKPALYGLTETKLLH